MNQKLAMLLHELEQFGEENDARNNEYTARMLNIAPDVGRFLVFLVRALRAKHILEIGTSNGYSTLWLAYAVEAIDGRVTTLERSDFKVQLARNNFRRAGLERLVDLRVSEASEFLRAESNNSFDLIFLDSERRQYANWWSDMDRLLIKGGVLVADNTLSHASEIAPFLRIVGDDPRYITTVVPLGNGEFVALKGS